MEVLNVRERSNLFCRPGSLSSGSIIAIEALKFIFQLTRHFSAYQHSANNEMALVTTKNKAKCPVLDSIDPHRLIPYGDWCRRITEEVNNKNMYRRRIQALSKLLAAEVGFFEVPSFLQQRLATWSNNALRFANIEQAAAAIVCLGTVSLSLLVPPAAHGEGKFLQRMRHCIEVCEPCDHDTASSASSVSVNTSSSRIAKKAIERSSGEISYLAAQYALTSTHNALNGAQPSILHQASDAVTAASDAALPRIEESVRSAAHATAEATTHATLEAASHRVMEVARGAAQAEAQATTIATINAASSHIRTEAWNAAQSASMATAHEITARGSRGSQNGCSGELRRILQEHDARNQGPALMQALIEEMRRMIVAVASKQKRYYVHPQQVNDDSHSDDESDFPAAMALPRTPIRTTFAIQQGAPRLTAGPLYDLQA